MMWRIEFRSAEFLPCLPEECQANPGAYGFELAFWLARALAARGLITSYPMAEDWGWFIEHTQGELEPMVGCSSMADEGEGYTGRPIRWSVFVNPRRSLWHRVQGKGMDPVVQQLTDAITATLVAHGIEVQQIER